MDNYKSYEFIFLYLINKCILLFKYIDNENQKNILFEIKIFINKLNEIFSTADFKNNEERKNKILEILINYFNRIIEDKIYPLMEDENKDNLIGEVEKIALNLCENNDNKNKVEKKIESKTILEENNIEKKIESKTILEENKVEKKKEYKIEYKVDNKVDNKVLVEKNSFVIKELEEKLNNKVVTIFNEIENNIKDFLKNYMEHTSFVEYDLDKKFNGKLDNYITKIEEKIKDLLNNNLLNNKIQEYIKFQLNKIYEYIDNIKNKNNYQDNEINKIIENKIRLLGDIFNNNIEDIYKRFDFRLIKNEEKFINIIEDKINSNSFNKNNFNIIFDKDLNEIKLYYGNHEIANTKINIKGLIGPKGPIGNKGESGYTPIIRKIKIDNENKIKLIIQENNNIYEITSEETIPLGPRGLPGERGECGKAVMDLKWNQENVMRVDEDNKESLIFLKSLCIGDKSHCMKENSLSIAGGNCYQNNSFAIGNNSKTLDTESIAYFGTCIGKKSFSYRADNVDENQVIFGKKDKLTYNINNIQLISKEINLECDSLKIKTNKYENNKLKELEDRINLLEKKIVDILKKF